MNRTAVKGGNQWVFIKQMPTFRPYCMIKLLFNFLLISPSHTLQVKAYIIFKIYKILHKYLYTLYLNKVH